MAFYYKCQKHFGKANHGRSVLSIKWRLTLNIKQFVCQWNNRLNKWITNGIKSFNNCFPNINYFPISILSFHSRLFNMFKTLIFPSLNYECVKDFHITAITYDLVQYFHMHFNCASIYKKQGYQRHAKQSIKYLSLFLHLYSFTSFSPVTIIIGIWQISVWLMSECL